MEEPIQPAITQKKTESIRKYLIEFVLVFAAIVLGFFAENLREYYSDRDKEQELAQLLLEDLQTDSVNVSKLMLDLDYQIGTHDSILALLKKSTYDHKILLIQLRKAGVYNLLPLANTTIEQIKGSNASLYFSDKKFVSNILKYYQIMENVEDRIQWLYNYTYDYIEPFEVKHTNRIFLNFISQDSIRSGGIPINDFTKSAAGFKDVGIALAEHDKIELYNLIWAKRLRMAILVEVILPNTKREAKVLIQQIKREYNLN
ncbi:MAG: hypothetical protein ACKO96_41400 [Flammeovirgaceae bacterium]